MQKGNAKVVAAGWGTYLNATLTIYSSNDDMKIILRENIHFGRVSVGLVWSESAIF